MLWPYLSAFGTQGNFFFFRFRSPFWHTFHLLFIFVRFLVHVPWFFSRVRSSNISGGQLRFRYRSRYVVSSKEGGAHSFWYILSIYEERQTFFQYIFFQYKRKLADIFSNILPLYKRKIADTSVIFFHYKRKIAEFNQFSLVWIEP